MIFDRQIDPKRILTLLNDLGATLSIGLGGTIDFISPDYIQSDVEVIFRSPAHRQAVIKYLTGWHPLVECVFCGVAITEQKEDPFYLETRLANDLSSLNEDGVVVCGVCLQPQTEDQIDIWGELENFEEAV